MYKKVNNRKKAFTVIELMFSLAIFALLSGSVYKVFTSVKSSFLHSQSRLEILQTTRIIMTGLKNELRNAYAKPQGSVDDQAREGIGETLIVVPVSEDKARVYCFDNATRKFYRGDISYSGNLAELTRPEFSDMHEFKFTDGQILAFSYDSSYRDANGFVESELMLDAKIWCRVTMSILYTEKYDKLTKEQIDEIYANMDTDPRVKTFSMMITPRKENWVLQATQ